MSYFLFFFWLIVLSWALLKIRFVKKTELGAGIVAGLFVCKVGAGVLAGWLIRADINSDSWGYHKKALFEYDLLFTNTKAYFTNLFYTGYSYGYDGLLQTQNSYWNDLKDNLIIKLVSVFDIFSGGNYYVNVVLYNFVIFFGGIGFYRVFKQEYKAGKLLTVAVVFLLPSVLFYSSTIHKDGLVLALMALVIFNVWQSLQTGFTFKRMLFTVIALLFLFMFRNFVVMALLPGLGAWIIAEKKKFSPVKTFAVIYGCTVLLFFTSKYLLPQVDLPGYMVQKQADFFTLSPANTTIRLDTLKPNPISFISIAPQAIQHSLLRPFVSDTSLSKKLLPLSLELIFYELLLLFFFFFRRKQFSFNHPFVLFCLLLGVSLCLVTGYIVPVIGAIVRYRSIYLPFIMGPFILGMDWNRMRTFAKIKK